MSVQTYSTDWRMIPNQTRGFFAPEQLGRLIRQRLLEAAPRRERRFLVYRITHRERGLVALLSFPHAAQTSGV
jgi:hypothetical protein